MARCFLYECEQHLYQSIKTKGDTMYLKCYVQHCNGSAKLKNGTWRILVSVIVAQTLSCPWTWLPDMQNLHTHGASLCMTV